jgi:hypothetical protein
MNVARRNTYRLVLLASAAALAGCNLVLGIDDVSSANGPDSGQRIFGSTAEPRPDAGGARSDAGAAGQADAAAIDADSSPERSAGRSATPPSDRDAAVAPRTPDAALDEDAGEFGEDAGAPR